jgi:hypothetical protein
MMKQNEVLTWNQNLLVLKGINCHLIAPGRQVTKGETTRNSEGITTYVAKDQINTMQ